MTIRSAPCSPASSTIASPSARARTIVPRSSAVLGGELLRLGERRRGLLLRSGIVGVERQVERHAEHVQRATLERALLREPDRGREHLLADRAELERDEDRS